MACFCAQTLSGSSFALMHENVTEEDGTRADPAIKDRAKTNLANTDERVMSSSETCGAKSVTQKVLLATLRHLVEDLLARKLSKQPFQTMSELGNYIRKAINSRFVSCKYGIEIERADIRLLRPNKWLNDKIMNMYFEMLQEHAAKVGKKVYVFSTYFYTTLERGYDAVSKWVEDTNLFDQDLVFMPVHLTNHWIFVCFDVASKKLEYFDSLGGYRSSVAHRIALFFVKEYFRRCNKAFSMEVDVVKGITTQGNSNDCGVFACIYARRRLEMSGFVFDKDYALLYRAMMVHEIYVGEVLYAPDHFQTIFEDADSGCCDATDAEERQKD